MTFEPSKPMPEWSPRTGLHPNDQQVVNMLAQLRNRYDWSKSRRERALILQISGLVQDLELQEPERVRKAISKLKVVDA